MCVALRGVVQHPCEIKLHDIEDIQAIRTCLNQVAEHASCTIYAVILNELSAVRRIVRFADTWRVPITPDIAHHRQRPSSKAGSAPATTLAFHRHLQSIAVCCDFTHRRVIDTLNSSVQRVLLRFEPDDHFAGRANHSCAKVLLGPQCYCCSDLVWRLVSSVTHAKTHNLWQLSASFDADRVRMY